MNLVIALLSTRTFITAERIRRDRLRLLRQRQRRGVLADVRARQERAARPRHPAGDRPGVAVRPDRGLPHQPRGLRAARRRADRRRGGRRRRRHPAVGVAGADHRHPGRPAQAAGRGRRRRRRRRRRGDHLDRGAARPARLGGGAGNPVVRHRLRTGGAVPASAVAQRALHHPHRRAVGRGHRPRPLVPRRPRPRPRRHPHLPAVAHRRRVDRDRPAPVRCSGPTGSTCARSSTGRSASGPPAGRRGCGSPTAAPPRCAGAQSVVGPRTLGGRAGEEITVDIGMSDRLAREIASYGADAVALEPQSLRDDVLAGCGRRRPGDEVRA